MFSKGFTLIELMVVVAIIAVLSAIGLTSYAKAQDQAKMAKTQQKMRTLYEKMQEYRLDYKKLPPDLATLVTKGYITSTDTLDEWGFGFNYTNNDGVAGTTFSPFWTNGPDKTNNRAAPYTYINGVKCITTADDWCLDLPYGAN